MNFSASGEIISVAIEMMLNYEGGATSEGLCGFDVVHCMRLFSFLLTEMQDFSGKMLSLPFTFSCTRPGFGDGR